MSTQATIDDFREAVKNLNNASHQVYLIADALGLNEPRPQINQRFCPRRLVQNPWKGISQNDLVEVREIKDGWVRYQEVVSLKYHESSISSFVMAYKIPS